MNTKNIKNEFEGSEDITDGNHEYEPYITRSNRTGTLPDRRNKLQKTSKQNLAEDSINKPTHIGYSEGFSENPNSQSK